MKVKHYFCKKSIIKNLVTIEGDEFFHLKSVMRGKQGDEVEIINGFIPIKIHDCILKSETAAIAIGAILKKENQL